MKILLAVLTGLALAAPRAALAQADYDPSAEEGAQPPPPPGELQDLPADEAPPSEPDFQTFHDALNAYGTWVYTDEYGWVWTPSAVPDDWKPYSDGQWLWTSYGWTWAGSEPWAWAPYHYGRWCYLPSVGWGWVPGYLWGPAWVTWRQGPGSIGWTPLAPGCPYGQPCATPVPYNQWCFTDTATFWGGPVHAHLYPTHYVQGNWSQTHPIRPAQGGSAVYQGPPRSMIAQAAGRPVAAVDIHPVSTATTVGLRSSGSVLNVYAPRFQAAAHPFTSARGGMVTTVSASQARGVGSLVRTGAVSPHAGRGGPGVRSAAGMAPGAHPAGHGAPAGGHGGSSHGDGKGH